MDTVLWIAQILLALIFLLVGGAKLLLPKPTGNIPKPMAYTEDFTQTQLRIIGLLEVLGALGIILPAATGILPWLTPLAAVGLTLVMVGAALTHVRRKEPIIPNVVLGAIAVFVVVGRAFIEPIV
jgi:uncharacterized membrane protein YphA (DoxX/SURF4 family)